MSPVFDSHHASAQGDLGCRVFVLDDDRTLAKGLARYLQFRGYESTAFDDPHAALTAILRDPPEIVITDFTMPKLDGLQLGRRVRESLSLDRMPWLILVSGITIPRSQRQDFDAHYTKPFGFNHLVEDLNRIWQREAPTQTIVPQASPQDLRNAI